MNRSIILLLNLLLTLILIPAATAADYDFKASWDRVAALADSARFDSANEVVNAILESAQAADNAEQWARALIERTRFHWAQRAQETAATNLMTADWPSDPFWQDVLNIYLAHTLMQYNRRYSYEIRNREHISDADPADLKSWSTDRLSREINSAFVKVWSHREQWGIESIGAWSLIVEPNTYPARIRGTLRDAVSYLWVEYLGNPRHWRPGHFDPDRNQDIELLISGHPLEDADQNLADPRLSALKKISFIMADLRDWHQGLGHDEAALEAELENLRRLHQMRTSKTDRITVREHLAKKLASFDAGYPWWSMGQAMLAGFIGQENDPDSLIRSRHEAEKGRLRHPDRQSGRLCASIVDEIEAKKFNINTMTSDAAEKRSIEIHHKNIDKLYFRAWRYDLAERLADTEYPIPTPDEIETLVEKTEPDLAWTVDLPDTPDYRMHYTFTGMPSCPAGAYIFAASRRRDFAPESNTISAHDIIVTDLVLTSQQLPDGPEFLVRSGRTGQAVVGVDLVLFKRHGGRKHYYDEATRMKTDSTGRAHFLDLDLKSFGILARRGEDLAWIERGRVCRSS